jgi:hypothetical protein
MPAEAVVKFAVAANMLSFAQMLTRVRHAQIFPTPIRAVNLTRRVQ